MQQFGFGWGPALYFALGDAKKNSFAAQFCRQNNYAHLVEPSLEQVRSTSKNSIIEGSLNLFTELEKRLPQLSIIYLGTDLSNTKEKELRMEYLKIGKCFDVPKVDYEEFRRTLYPNLIFVFGAVEQQCYLASSTLANTLGYSYSFLPAEANEIVTHFDKSKNYVINGFFNKASDIRVLESYFNFRVIHFGYLPENLPKYQTYFDFEYDLLPLVQSNPYFISINGSADPVDIMDEVTKFLCPNLLFASFSSPEGESYVNQYLQQTGGLKLSILQIQHIRKRKNLPLAANAFERLNTLTHILYVDLNRKEVLLTDFPFETEDFIQLENINKKISFFIDLCDPKAHRFTKNYSSPIYFLENQKRISPTMDQPLSVQLAAPQPYWIVTGPGTCGKTSVAKFISSQFGYKYIDYETECGAVKEKVASPEDGEEVPARKFIQYFAKLVKSNPELVYVFDGVSYEGENLQEWVKVMGSPNVVNLKVEPEHQIKRARKKAEGDMAAEMTEEEITKAAEQTQKNTNWVENLCESCPSSKVYQVDYKLPQLLAQPLLISILKPRIFLVQANNHLTYQNIALRHNLGFINLSKNRLSECQLLIKACGKRDVILCNYQTEQDTLVSQQLYWIQKNLGDIRYLGIWEPEPKEIKEQLLHLERPPAQEKPKKPEGEEQEEKQQEAEEGEDGAAKKKFDIYEHEWTQAKSHKNLSQWFFKLKKNIKEKITEDPRECFDSFGEVLATLNSDKVVCVYETVK